MAGRIFTKSVTLDGIKFDSEMESQYYLLLKEREQRGEIFDLMIHHEHTLIKGFTNANGKTYKPIIYESDFEFFDKELNKYRYIDVKGMITDDFKLKWKMFDLILKDSGCYLEVLKHSKTTGWVEYEDYKRIMREKKKEKTAFKNLLLKENKKLKKELSKLQGGKRNGKERLY